MTCESVRELLPDFTLGALSELQAAEVRRHLRGCSSCRADAAALDQGVALFASAAHATEPPADLKDRVLTVMADEWTEAAPKPSRRFPRWMAVAAAAVVVAGSLGWASASQVRTNNLAEEA